MTSELAQAITMMMADAPAIYSGADLGRVLIVQAVAELPAPAPQPEKKVALA